MATQVGVGEVVIVPILKGVRSKIANAVDGATKEAAGVFEKGFASAGTKAGADSGKGFHAAFSGQTTKTVEQLTASMRRDVAKAASAVSQARLKEQDSAGKVRLAETQLGEARAKYASDSSQVVRAEERLQSAQRELASRQDVTREATTKLKTSQANLAEATERVEREMRDAAQAADHAGDEFRQAGAQADSATGEMARAGAGGATGFLGGLKGGLGKVAGVVGAALIAADLVGTVSNVMGDVVRSAIGYVQESVSVASDLRESVNAVEVSYGAAAESVLKLGENSARAFGLSKNDLNAYATQFSAFVKTIAGDGGNIAGTFEQLVGRGTDFASVMNLEVSEALGLFQSGLAGETEPLRKYGIDLSAATVEAYALANGIGDGTGALTEAEKVQARYGALLEQTSLTAGDFKNTQDELANATRTNSALWEDAQASLGEALLPALTELAVLARDELIPVLEDVIAEVGPQLGEAFAEAAPAIGDLLIALAPLIPELVTLVTEALPPMVDLLTALAPLWVDNADQTALMLTALTGLLDLIQGDTSIEDLGKKMFDTSETFRGFLFVIGETVAGFMNGVAQLKAGAAEIAVGIAVKIQEAINWIQSLPGRAQRALGNLGGTLRGAGQALIDGFIRGINDMIGRAGDAAAGVVDWVRGFFPFSPAKRGPLSGAGWTKLASSGEAYISQWTSGVEDGARRFTLPDMVREASALTLAPGFGSSAVAVGSAVGVGAGITNVFQGNYYGAPPPEWGEQTERAQRRANRTYGVEGIR